MRSRTTPAACSRSIAATGEIRVADGAVLDLETLGSAQGIVVTVTDAGGLSYREGFAIELGNVNEGPVDLALTGGSVLENALAGTVVGRVTGVDPDAGDVLTYALADDAGGLFAIDAESGEIRVADGAVLDLETLGSAQEIVVTVTDAGGLSYKEGFAIELGNVNEGPIDLSLSTDGVSGSVVAGTVVGIVQGTDPDAGDVLTYSLADDAGGLFVIDDSTGEIKLASGGLPGLDLAAQHDIVVEVTDAAGAAYQESFTLDLASLNEGPSDLVMSSGGAIAEDAVQGAVVGQVDAVDPDAGDSFTFSLIDDAAGRFAIDAGTGEITVADPTAIDFESAASHDITVRVTDSGGLTYDETMTIDVTDANEAPGSVTVTATGDDYTLALQQHDLVGHWRLDDSGTTVVDQTGDHTDTDGINGATMGVASGPFAGLDQTAASFDGVNDYIAIDHSDEFDLADGTISLWFNIDQMDGGNDTLFSMNDWGGGGYQDAGNTSIYVQNGSIFLYMEDNDSRYEINAGTISSGEWHQMALSFGSEGMQLYVDGELVGSNDYTGGIGNHFQNPIVIGASTYDSDAGQTNYLDHFFDGEIAEVALTGNALSADQIADLYQAGVNAEEATAATVAEGAATGTVVATVGASDSDSASLSYSLDDDAGGRFAIDAATGEITVADGSAIDFETDSSHVITVRVTDSDGGSTVQDVTIGVADDGNLAPIDIAVSGARTVVQEDFDSGATGWSDNTTSVGGAGLDGSYLGNFGGSNGEQVVYKTFDLSGDQQSVTIEFDFLEFDTWNGEEFKIWVDDQLISTDIYYTQEFYSEADSSTYGTATSGTSSNLAHWSYNDQTHRYELTINTAADSVKVGFGSNLDEAKSQESWGIDNFQITENFSSTTIGVDEDALAGTSLGTIGAVDPENAGGLAYSLDDDAGGRFAIDAATGEITVADASAIDFETDTSHVIKVRVTDAQGESTLQDITVDVNDVDDTGAVPVDDPLVGGAGDDGLTPDGGASPSPSPTHEGGAGDDQIYGSYGDDAIYGGAGQDQVYGEDGDDYIFGEGDDDQLFGNAGNDTLDGGDGNDQFYGGSGNDVIYGQAGLDQIYGEAGDDVIDGGSGDDQLYGGDGADHFLIIQGQGNDFVSGGDGAWTDVIELQSGDSGSVGSFGSDWTVDLTNGEIESANTEGDGGWLDLTDDAAGTITLQDGTEIDFEGIEHIQW